MDLHCKECGSDKVIPDVRIVDQGDSSDGKLQLRVCGNPDAIIFKDRLYGVLTAEVCGECGRVELRVANAGELYDKYQESLRDR